MTVTYCDVTEKEVENATTSYAWRIRKRRYDIIAGRDLSVDGLKTVEDAVRAEMAKSETYDFMTYKRILAEKLRELCG